MTIRTHVAHVVADLAPNSGGPSTQIAGLCDALSGFPDLQTTLLTQRRKGAAEVPSTLDWPRRRSVASDADIALALGRPLRDELTRVVQSDRPSVIHCHGLWMGVNFWAAHIAFANGIPLALQPHGMLAPWALGHRSWKKRIALALFQRRALARAQVLVATSEMEYADIRRFGLSNPVAILPNAIALEQVAEDQTPAERPAARERTVLFLGRLAPIKGLPHLLQAWSRVRRPGWRLQVAGPDSDGHLAELSMLARHLRLGDSVQFTGPVDLPHKSACYQSADVFVLPSFTENFGMVVAEALAHGLPVIATRGAPWAGLPQAGCGWWVEPEAGAIGDALSHAMSLDDEERRAMGARGRQYVQRFGWRNIAAQAADLYRWMAGHGATPAFVREA